MISWLARTTAWHLRPLRLARCFPHICLFLRGGRDQDHFGGAIPYWACLPERLQVADQDRRVHQRHEMRARAAGQRDRAGERPREIEGVCGHWGEDEGAGGRIRGFTWRRAGAQRQHESQDGPRSRKLPLGCLARDDRRPSGVRRGALALPSRYLREQAANFATAFATERGSTAWYGPVQRARRKPDSPANSALFGTG